jgi:hypothetical protein
MRKKPHTLKTLIKEENGYLSTDYGREVHSPLNGLSGLRSPMAQINYQ